MSVAKAASYPNATLSHPGRQESDPERLQRLRALAEQRPAQARQQAWEWLKELQAPSQHYRLAWLFAQGTAPESPDGDCEGVVMNLYGSWWASAVDLGVRLGRLLGGIGWTGKTFNAKAGTGYNRLTASTNFAARVVMPHYSFKRVNGELTGFHFYHALETSPLPPHAMVRAIKYDAPEHANPLMLPNTRDELIELLPNVYLGRALHRNNREWRVIGYFGLRYPMGGGV